MTKTIERFYSELQVKFNQTLDEMIASFVITNLSSKLLKDWDDIITWLDKTLEDIESREEDERTYDDCLKIAAVYVIFAIMYKLDESGETI